MKQPSEDDGRGLVVLVHGSTLHHSSWLPWAEHLDANGYESVTVTWPAEPAGIRLGQVISRVEDTLASLSRPSILVGHGTGAVLVEGLVDRPTVAAGIAIAPVPLRRLRSRFSAHGQGLTRESFHRCYANEVSREGSDVLFETFVAPIRVRGVSRDAARITRRLSREPRSPLLLLSAGRDRIATEASIASHAGRLRSRYPDQVTDHFVFPDRSHALVIDERWPDVANHCLDWLTGQGL